MIAQDAIDEAVAEAIRDTVSTWTPASTINVDALTDATIVIRWLDEAGTLQYEQEVRFNAERTRIASDD